MKIVTVRRERFSVVVRMKDDRAYALVRGDDVLMPQIFLGRAYYPGFPPARLYHMQRALARLMRRRLREHDAVHLGGTGLRLNQYYRYDPMFLPPHDRQRVAGMSAVRATTWAFRRSELPDPSLEDVVRTWLADHPYVDLAELDPISSVEVPLMEELVL